MTTLFDELQSHQHHKHDGRTFGLVLQGGGMRGVYTAGIIAPLVKYELTNAFDHVIGSSAGAINGAYLLGADANTMRTYTDDLTNKNFVNLLRSEKKVDIDYLVDLVLKDKRPVNINNLLRSSSELHIVMTDAKNGKRVVVSDHHKFVDIYEEFRATAALPLLYDKPVLVNGHWYIDGGVSDLVPVDVAEQLGCTDIVVILTRQLADYHFGKRHNRLVKHLIKRFARRLPLAIQGKLPTDERMLRANLRRLTRHSKDVRIYVLEPSDEESIISLGTIDKPRVEALARLGVQDMDNFLHRPLD